MTLLEQQALLAAVSAFCVALFTYLTLRVQQMSSTIKQHNQALNGPVSEMRATVSGNSAAIQRLQEAGGAGSTVAVTPIPVLPVPLWDQHKDPNPDGLPDRYAETDCGWEACCVVARSCRGISVAEGDARTQLRGTLQQGISSARNLLDLLLFWHFAATAHDAGTATPYALIEHALAEKHPLIALGNWIAPSVLHWVVIVGQDVGTISYEDPWYGRIVRISRPEFSRLYGGVLIDVGEPARYT